MPHDEMVPKDVAIAMARLGEQKTREIEGLMRAIAPIIVSAIIEVLEPVKQRVSAIESRPSLKYCGVWNEETQNNEGDFVTDHGSLWYCKAPTRSRPGTSGDWQLAVKRGKDGVR